MYWTRCREKEIINQEILTLENGTIGCPETSARNCQSTERIKSQKSADVTYIAAEA